MSLEGADPQVRGCRVEYPGPGSELVDLAFSARPFVVRVVVHSDHLDRAEVEAFHPGQYTLEQSLCLALNGYLRSPQFPKARLSRRSLLDAAKLADAVRRHMRQKDPDLLLGLAKAIREARTSDDRFFANDRLARELLPFPLF